jgi:cytochrome c oxidase subunit III
MFRSTLNNARKGRKNSSNAETMAVFAMVSVVILFAPLLLLLGRSVSTSTGTLYLPATFHLSTLVILASSWTLSQAKHHKSHDRIKRLKQYLSLTLLLALLFLVLQYAGWTSLVQQYRMQQRAVNFIVVLAILHGVHLLFGLIVLLVMIIRTYRLKTGAELYIHFLKPARDAAFRILSNYWHFVDLLWIFMYVVFVIKLA